LVEPEAAQLTVDRPRQVRVAAVAAEQGIAPRPLAVLELQTTAFTAPETLILVAAAVVAGLMTTSAAAATAGPQLGTAVAAVVAGPKWQRAPKALAVRANKDSWRLLIRLCCSSPCPFFHSWG
jgi:hypothetical protein